jgi:hypothetical protein
MAAWVQFLSLHFPSSRCGFAMPNAMQYAWRKFDEGALDMLLDVRRQCNKLLQEMQGDIFSDFSTAS